KIGSRQGACRIGWQESEPIGSGVARPLKGPGGKHGNWRAAVSAARRLVEIKRDPSKSRAQHFARLYNERGADVFTNLSRTAASPCLAPRTHSMRPLLAALTLRCCSAPPALRGLMQAQLFLGASGMARGDQS